MSSGTSNLLTEAEQTMSQRLSEDFPNEVQRLEEALDILRRYLQHLNATNPVLSREGSLGELAQAAVGERCSAVWTMLLCEAYERLSCAQLLLLTGHQSRALSCARDTIECLQWAHVCLKDEHEAARWINGRKVKHTRDFEFPQQISSLLTGDAKNVLNRHGTHAYIQACTLSVYPLAGLDPGATPDQGNLDMYNAATLRSFMAILYVVGATIEYVVNIGPDLEKEVASSLSIRAALSETVNRLFERVKAEVSA